ncbi:hypothetical protein MUA02_10425 [Enterobacteriaceae bacterium H20N1]|uniref:Uncharacterized protein n=1 Tax=Dryocola boscaweniae TaxID=2925397 RepID=A0A9X2W6P9_9ENTR|nr:hypothetical protein [Dryocola boscaweniae]MCT4702105.1 hypothetical protein [Dryocola boscaweniae]MCT4719451.1 hypothetical protein [Dryocola boscaweniae]
MAKKKRIAADFEVPCLLVPDASARTVSFAENLLATLRSMAAWPSR